MQTIDYNEVLQPLVELYGLQYSNLESELAGRYKGFISRRLRTAWEDAHWPDLMRIEKRRFAPAYDDNTVYYNGDFVYWPRMNAYYQCLASQISGQAPTDSSDEVQKRYWILAGKSFSGDDWASGTSYVAGDITYHEDRNRYVQCLQDTSSDAPTDVAYWGALHPFRRILKTAGETEASLAVTTAGHGSSLATITVTGWPDVDIGDRIRVASITPAGYNGDFDVLRCANPAQVQYTLATAPGAYSTGGTVQRIYLTPGLVRAIYDRDPEVHANWNELAFSQVDNGWLVYNATSEVWVEYRLQSPLLTGSDYDSTATYAVGDQILFTNSGTKNFYNCLVATSAGESPTTDPHKWEVVEIPRFLQTYLVYGALSDALKMDGNHAAAGVQLKIAQESLEEEQIKAWNLQPQRNRIAVAAY